VCYSNDVKILMLMNLRSLLKCGHFLSGTILFFTVKVFILYVSLTLIG
jgi:hypothetical protein